MSPPVGVWDRVSERSRSLLAAGRRALSPPLSAGYYGELEELLITADVGPSVASRLTTMVRSRGPKTPGEAEAALLAAARGLMSTRGRDLDLAGAPACVLFYGVNGAGKTTSIAKLAWRLVRAGRKPLVVAADTYRAAGAEQMTEWADRVGVPSFAGAPGADPASVVFDGIRMAGTRGQDTVLVDTAGRLHSQGNLLAELAKIGRVTSRALAGTTLESLLVIDAVLGLSSLSQAQAFNRAIPMTGLVLAKLDGSAKGGAVVSIEAELGVPVKLAGVGEKKEDLLPFDPDAFLEALFS